MSAYDHFIKEMLGDPELAPLAAEFNRALTALDIEGDYNPHALQLFEGVMWIINHRERPVAERAQKVLELVSMKGKVVVNMREFSGWR
jgi:hypothetical protein